MATAALKPVAAVAALMPAAAAALMPAAVAALMPVAAAALLPAAATLLPAAAAAQDFTGAAPAGAWGSAHALLERGLPAAAPAAAIEGAAVRWFGLAELATRSAAVAAGRGPLRAAVGLSSTGDAELGWNAAGAALGLAGPRSGAALRAAARRDRAPDAAPGPLGRGAGAELGAGAWVAPSPAVAVWAQAPQLWSRGRAPPLARRLEIGVRWRGEGIEAWLARRAPETRGRSGGDRVAGAALALPGVRLWLEARDRPLRATLGVAARAGALALAASVESHPALGETVALSLALGGSGGDRRRGARRLPASRRGSAGSSSGAGRGGPFAGRAAPGGARQDPATGLR